MHHTGRSASVLADGSYMESSKLGSADGTLPKGGSHPLGHEQDRNPGPVGARAASLVRAVLRYDWRRSWGIPCRRPDMWSSKTANPCVGTLPKGGSHPLGHEQDRNPGPVGARAASLVRAVLRYDWRRSWGIQCRRPDMWSSKTANPCVGTLPKGGSHPLGHEQDRNPGPVGAKAASLVRAVLRYDWRRSWGIQCRRPDMWS